MSIPNFLTIIRLLLIPTFVLAFYLPWRTAHIIATVIFVVGAVTDLLDGYLARSLKQDTKFGAFLDPVVDKLIVVTALLLVVGAFGEAYVTIPSVVIIGREIMVSALREWMSEIGKRTSVAVGFVGKVKTAIQMVAVILLLLYLLYVQEDAVIFKIVGVSLLYTAAFLTLFSMVIYIKAAWPDLTFRKEKG